ncbi:MAG: polysaccharide biosynthesis tyrosine autokinase [Bacteroidota bacterium]
MNHKFQAGKAESDSLDIKGFVFKLFDHWYYFAISVGFFVALGLFYIKKTSPTFNVKATMLISQPTEADMPGDAIMESMRKYGSNRSLDNELGIFTSYKYIRDVIRQLHFEVVYFEKGLLRDVEMYKNLPFEVQLDSSAFQMANVSYFITMLPNDRYRISIDADEGYQLVRMMDDKVNSYPEAKYKYEEEGKFGEPFSTDKFTFTINKLREFKVDNFKNRKLYFSVKKPQALTDKYRNKLKIDVKGEESSVVDISLKGTVPKKEVEFLQTLCDTYIKDRLIEKNHLASKTIEFIDVQLSQVSDSLQQAEGDLARAERAAGTFDPSAIAAEYNTRLLNTDESLANSRRQYQYLNAVLLDLSDENSISGISQPVLVGLNDATLDANLISLKELYADKTTYDFLQDKIKSELADTQIKDLIKRITESVRGLIQNKELEIQSLEGRRRSLRSKLASLPSNNLDRTNIMRRINITDQLYNYLVQKRTEAGITKIANTPDSKVLDDARMVGNGPVGPNKGLIMGLSLMFALLIPILVIYAKDMFDDSIKSQNQIEEMSGVPVIGTIAHNSEDEELYELNNLTSQVVESFRYLKVNLQFIGPNSPKKIIGLTSTIPQEGKTFCAFNLASVTAVSGSKVVVVGADIRKPALYRIAGLENKLGLTNYLINQANLDQVIQKTHLKNLDVITSGPIPPNPTDLLNKPKFADLLKELQEVYDYIFIDTPPIGLVSDFLLISQHTHFNLYVMRQGFSKVDFVQEITKVRSLSQSDNIFVVLNDIKFSSRNYYGYKYGKSYPYKYGLEPTAKPYSSKKGLSKLFNKKKTISV